MIFSERPDGFKPKISVVACYLLFNGEFILLQRQPDKTHGGKWGLPAGKIDEGEDEQTAVVREVFEETGIEIARVNLKRLKPLWVENEGSQIEYHSFITELSEPVEVILSNNEHQAYTWVAPEKSLGMDLIHDLDECNRLFFSI